MCGDLDEDDRAERVLYDRFRSHAVRLLNKPSGGQEVAQSGAVPVYLDKLFADALTRCLRDGDALDDSRRYEALAAQPLAFARLAGFLAAHASPQEDPLRKVIEALMHGYAEAERIEPEHGHEHGEGHSHVHDHHH